MRVAVFGAGYVGLIQGAGLASTGNHVTLIEIDESKVKRLQDGECPIYEPGLPELLSSGRENQLLEFCALSSTELPQKLNDSEIIFLAVGTPEAPNGEADLTALWACADYLISKVKLDDKVIVVKSTVPVGTGDKLQKKFETANAKAIVVSNPEFLKQGSAVADFLKPERVIVGTDSEKAKSLLLFLYHPFMLKRERMVSMSRRSSELTKYACNAYLANRISFINEMAVLSEKMGADIREVREGMITDARIGEQFLFPGIGYGGSCLPKDTAALVVQAKAHGTQAHLVEASVQVNRNQGLWAINSLKRIFGDNLKGKTIALWGLSFKPNTDDLREAPSLRLIHRAIEEGMIVQAFDPKALSRAEQQLKTFIDRKNLRLFTDPYKAAQGASALVLVTEWSIFRSPDFVRLKQEMKEPHLLDGRLIYDPAVVRSYGFKYAGIGLSLDEL